MFGRAARNAPPLILKGSKVTLRPFRMGFSPEEVARQYRWDRDEEVLYWSGGHRTMLSLEEYERYLSREAKIAYRNRDSFAILDERGELIGRIGYYELDRRRRRAKLGVVLGEKEYWGQGYGRDAMAAFLQYLFQDLGLERVYLATFPNNLRAQRSFESCGLRRSGTDREFFLDWGWRDEILMEVEGEEFLRALQEREPVGQEVQEIEEKRGADDVSRGASLHQRARVGED